jgi:hypothetical protein
MLLHTAHLVLDTEYMPTFPKFNDFQIEGKRVFVRVDIDIEDKILAEKINV